MRIFKFWVAPEFRFEHGGQTFSGHCFGGSSVSVEEAKRDAQSRWEGVVSRIKGEAPEHVKDYVADIREEVLREIDSRNIVTRNRYGAEVLNTADHMFLDIDFPPWSWRDLFGSPKSVSERQARILAHVRKIAATSAFSNAGIRIYQTPLGIRLLVTGLEHSPRSAGTAAIMKTLHVDRIYMRLCRKQECYRARLTPKPSRIGIRTPKCTVPRDEPTEQRIKEWVFAYDAKRGGFAACKLLETLGPFERSAVSDFHDDHCRATGSMPMA